MQKSLHAIFWSLASRIVTFSLILIQGIFVARMLGPAGKGLQALLMTTAGLIVVTLDFGLSNSINYFIGKKKLHTGNLLKTVCYILTGQIASVLIFVSVMLFTSLGHHILNIENQAIFAWIYLGCTAIFDLFRLNVTSILSAHLQFSWLNRVDSISALGRVLAYGAIFILKKEDPLAIWYVLAIDLAINVLNLMSLLAVFFLKAKKMDEIFKLGSELKISALFLYSTPIFLSNILNYFNTRFDFWLVEKNMGLESLGYYAMASTGAQLLFIVPSVFGGIIFSYLNKMSEAEQRETFTIYSRLSFSIVFFGVVCALLLSNLIIVFLYGENFSSSVPLFQLMLLTTLIQSFRYLLGIFCQATNQNKLRLRSDLITAAFNLIFLIFALKYFGLIGLICILSLSQLIGCIDLMINLKMPFKNILSLLFIQRKDLLHFKKTKESL